MSAIVPATLTTWYEYAEELKAALVTAIGETADAPEDLRSYIDWERPMLLPDCDQLVVSGLNVGQSSTIGQPSQSGVRHIHGAVNLVGFLVTIARACAPTFDDHGNPPAEAAISAAAKLMFDTTWAIWTRIYQLKRADTLFEGKARELYMDGGRALETTGGLLRAEIEIRAEIYGIIAS